MRQETKLGIALMGIALGVLFLLNLVNADSEAIFPCGGDSELIIGCLGDSENAPIGYIPATGGGNSVTGGGGVINISSPTSQDICTFAYFKSQNVSTFPIGKLLGCTDEFAKGLGNKIWPGMGIAGFIIIILLIVAGWFFFIIGKRRKKKEEVEKMQDESEVH